MLEIYFFFFFATFFAGSSFFEEACFSSVSFFAVFFLADCCFGGAGFFVSFPDSSSSTAVWASCSGSGSESFISILFFFKTSYHFIIFFKSLLYTLSKSISGYTFSKYFLIAPLSLVSGKDPPSFSMV